MAEGHVQTANQTVGPYFRIGLIREGDHVMAQDGVRGTRMALVGRVLDGEGRPVVDAMIEVWQPDADGVFAHPADPRHASADPAFRGFGRAHADDQGFYRFETVKPGRLPPDGETRWAPHVNLRVFARGMLVHAVTRVFFEDDDGLEDDPVLASVAPDRRSTLLARREDDESGVRYRFDIRLQGEGETVFFDP